MRNKLLEYRSRWVEFYLGKSNIDFRISPASYFDDRAMLHISFLFFSLYIHFNIKSGIDDCDYPEYGFYTYGEGKIFSSFWWCWGMKKKCFYMPWDWEWVRTSNLKKDQISWEHETKGNSKQFYDKKWDDIIWKDTMPYNYTLKNGEVQNRTATIKVEEREWRMRALMWLPYPRIISKTINVEFNDEVGERTGSWKGGTLGCSYTIKPTETPFESLRRMEKERKFN